MKRFSALLLAILLGISLAAPALAATAPDMEASLAAVTAAVKETLQVDDSYTEFSGNYYDDLTLTWNLNWSDAERSLSVTCDEAGKVLEVYTYQNETYADWFTGFEPAFPALSQAKARAQAMAWLTRLLGEGETARIDRESVSLRADGYYTFQGTVLLYGTESPITFQLRIDENGLRRYSRSDEYSPYVGELDPQPPEVSQLAAGVSLGSALELELFYVLDAAENAAELRYVPTGPYTVVDALTGEAVDMDTLYASFEENGAAMAMDTAAAAEAPEAEESRAAGLTAVELDSIAQYGDVLAQDALDSLLRGISPLGIGDAFSLDRCSYAMDSASGEVTASLRYTAPITDDELYGYSKDAYEQALGWGEQLTVYKSVTVNAKSGELLSVSTSYPLWDRDPGEQNPEALRQQAEEFLHSYAGDMYASSAFCTLEGYNEGDSFTYARVENGYFFPANYLSLQMNSATGTVDSYRAVWDEDVTFGPARGIISSAEAALVYADALDVTLGYVAWPEAIRENDPVFARYIAYGYSWVESLRLGYYYAGLDSVIGVDARTGEALIDSFSETGAYTYTDLALAEAREAIEALGEAGIGFAGGLFQPSAILTQRDGVTLLLQAAGHDVSDWSDDTLGQEAAWLGFVAQGEWVPDAPLTRMAFLKMLLSASPYGEAAKLGDIWREAFADVAPEDAGYAAIASALGMVSGGELKPDSVCLRGAAAEMLYAFMTR